MGRAHHDQHDGIGPLGTLHDDQRGWHPVGRFAWWAFLLPLAIFAWSSWRLRGAVRLGGYLVAGWVLLVGLVLGLAVAVAPFAPPTTTTASITRADPAPAKTPSAASATPAPVASPVAASAPRLVAAPPVVHRVAPKPSLKPVAKPVAKPSLKPVAPRTVTPEARPTLAPGNPVGDTYTNVDGNQIQRPVAAASQPAGATAKCQDGTWSFSQHHAGTCSGHGGVAQFL